MNQKEFSLLSSKIPLLPGIYKYFDSTNKLIYVGKAKNLKKRVSSYFNNNISNQKTIELVKKINSIEFTIVDTEEDAFFLESSLIKEYQPHYNINLKDGKGYPYVVIKNENFSRVFFSRKKINDGSQYFGPYSSISNAKEIIEFVKQMFPFRTCTLNLSPKKIIKNKYKVCLEYHLGNCKGPCEGLQSIEEYNEGLSQLKSLLKGNLQPLLNDLKNKIKEHSSNLEFEKAAFFQNKINLLSVYQAKSTVVNTKIAETDIFSIVEEGNLAYINYLFVNNGSVVRTKTIFVEKKLDETAEQVLPFAIAQLRDNFESNAKEIIVPFDIKYPELLELSQKNVNFFLTEIAHQKRLHLEDKNDEEREKLLTELQLNLRLSKIPRHIECFDNSNLQGSNAVAAMVCFKDGMPSKNDYRRFKIKTVVGIDDFSSMREIVYRRYYRVLKENEVLPDLIIIDGGKGQLNAALESIDELGIRGKVTLVGLAKNKEEIFFANDKESILLDWNSDTLKLVRRIRDEVHRFGITFHRNTRSNNAIKNELESIPGIGTSSADLLLKKFKSVKKIKDAAENELIELVGKSKTELIKRYLK